jgi:hypothetical protein
MRRRRKAAQYVPPVPLAWFDRACVLPGKALAVGLVLWRLARLKKTNSVLLTNAALKRHGLARWAKYPALQALERAGLVAVRRRPKRSPEVTLLEPPADPARLPPRPGGGARPAAYHRNCRPVPRRYSPWKEGNSNSFPAVDSYFEGDGKLTAAGPLSPSASVVDVPALFSSSSIRRYHHEA